MRENDGGVVEKERREGGCIVQNDNSMRRFDVEKPMKVFDGGV